MNDSENNGSTMFGSYVAPNSQNPNTPVAANTVDEEIDYGIQGSPLYTRNLEATLGTHKSYLILNHTLKLYEPQDLGEGVFILLESRDKWTGYIYSLEVTEKQILCGEIYEGQYPPGLTQVDSFFGLVKDGLEQYTENGHIPNHVQCQCQEHEGKGFYDIKIDVELGSGWSKMIFGVLLQLKLSHVPSTEEKGNIKLENIREEMKKEKDSLFEHFQSQLNVMKELLQSQKEEFLATQKSLKEENLALQQSLKEELEKHKEECQAVQRLLYEGINTKCFSHLVLTDSTSWQITSMDFDEFRYCNHLWIDKNPLTTNELKYLYNNGGNIKSIRVSNVECIANCPFPAMTELIIRNLIPHQRNLCTREGKVIITNVLRIEKFIEIHSRL